MKNKWGLWAAIPLAAILGLGILAPVAASARAGGPYVETVTSDAVVCRTTSSDDRFRVQARVYQDTNGTNYFHAQVFENHGDINLVIEAFGEANWSASGVRAAGTLYDPHGEPVAGDAYMASAYTPTGETTTVTGRTQEGNQRIMFETTKTHWQLSETSLSIADYQLNPLDCIGNEVTETRTFTTPATFVNVDRSFEVSGEYGCNLELGGEITASITGRELSLIVSFIPGDVGQVSGTLHLNGDRGQGELAALDAEGTPTGGTVATQAKVTQIGPAVVDGFDEDPVSFNRRMTPYRLDLALDLPSGRQTVSCAMERITQRLRVNLPR